MTSQAYQRRDWAAVIEEHALESHDPSAWLRYGVALLQTIEPGPDQGRQQQQAALAFLRAGQEGAAAEQVQAYQQRAVLLALAQAMDQLGMAYAAPSPVPQLSGPPVCLTAISRRLKTLPKVVESLKKQSLRPRRIELYLSKEPHLLDQGIDPAHPVVQKLEQDPAVRIHWVPNLGPYRKVVPFLESHKGQAATDDDLFITVDDDTLYPPRFVEYLTRNHERYGCVVAHRGRRIRVGDRQGFLPYAQWHDGLHEPRLANLPTGQSGVLYRRSFFPADLELESALALAPTHDDLWLRWLTARQGVPAVILQPNAAARTEDHAFPLVDRSILKTKQTLWFAYNVGDSPANTACTNDAASQAIQHHFQQKGFDLEAVLRDEQERHADFY